MNKSTFAHVLLFAIITQASYLPAPKNYPNCQLPPDDVILNYVLESGKHYAYTKLSMPYNELFCGQNSLDTPLLKTEDDYNALKNIRGNNY